MKKRTLSKQILLAAGLVAVSFACNSKKTDSRAMQPPAEQTAPCDSGDGSCNMDEDDVSSDQSDESSSVAPQASQEPVVEQEAKPEEANTAAVSVMEQKTEVSSSPAISAPSAPVVEAPVSGVQK